jgi:8-oxo-dGTP pyrophosphatase MutT (NUDIX family)
MDFAALAQQMVTISVDTRFGNTTITYQIPPSSCSKLLMDISEVDQNNVIILKGLNSALIEEYNSHIEEEHKKIIYQPMHDSSPIYVIFNNSSCPRLHVIDDTNIGQIFSASIAALVTINDITYCIFVKDKTKPFAGLPGGTANSEEVNIGHVNYNAIALRELYEETGIQLDPTTPLRQIMEVQYAATLFGVLDIPDTNHTFTITLDEVSIHSLFSKEYKDEKTGIFTMGIDNSEISNILAIPLIELPKDVDIILRTKPKEVSALSYFAAMLAYNGGIINPIKKIEGFPSNMKKLTICE